jgi:hypothetical protein
MSASRPILTATAATAAIATAVATAAAVAITPLATATAATATAAAATHAARGPAPAAKPGRTASPVTLDNNVELSGYDAVTDSSGRTYIGWISDKNNKGRKVHLCTLPPGARQCSGGIQTIDSLGDSSAEGLRILVSSTGEVTLVWFHDTTASETGPQGGEIAAANSDAGGPLSPGFDMASAPSFGSLLDARLGPGSQIWTIAGPSAGKTGVQVRTDLFDPMNSFVALKTPYVVGAARVRFHANTAVLAIQKGGAITTPVAYASNKNGTWTAFHKLAHTWTSDAVLGLSGTSSGIRLITSVNNASYFPVVWSWTGSTFARPTLTGDFNNCSPNSHDAVSDASGRLADVSRECEDVAVANLPDTRHAAVVRFKAGGTFAGGDPQLTTTARGKGWVVWSIESSVANKLLAAPVLLAGLDVTAAKTARGNRVVVTGPASCLPPVDIAVGVKGKPATHWRVVSSVLKLGGTTLHSKTLDGGTLKAGARYTLYGTVRFANGASHVTITASLKFRSCPNG